MKIKPGILLLIIAAVAAISALITAQCYKGAVTTDKLVAVVNDAGDDKAIIVQVGDSKISVDEFRDYLAARPIPVHMEVTDEVIRSRLDEVIVLSATAQEAQRLGIDKSPPVKRRIQEILAQNVIDEKVVGSVHKSQITDERIQEYYDKNVGEYNRPDQRRIADVFIKSGPDASVAQQADTLTLAVKVQKEALALQGKSSGFGKLLEKYSAAPDKGFTGFFDQSGAPIGLDPILAKKAFEMKKVGEISDTLIETSDGYHIIMLVGRRSGIKNPFAKVKAQIAERLYRQMRQETRRVYIAQLKERFGVKIDSSALAELTKQVKLQTEQERSDPVNPGS